MIIQFSGGRSVHGIGVRNQTKLTTATRAALNEGIGDLLPTPQQNPVMQSSALITDGPNN